VSPQHIRSFIDSTCDFRDKSEDLKRLNQWKNCIRLKKICKQKILVFFEYYVRILALKLGDNQICYGTLCLYTDIHMFAIAGQAAGPNGLTFF